MKEYLSETVTINQKWKQKVHLLKILPDQEMGNLLRLELLGQGWEEEKGHLQQSNGDWNLQFDPITRMLSISYDREEIIEASFDDEVDIYEHTDNREKARREAHDQIRSSLDQRLSGDKKKKEEELEREFEKVRESLLEKLETEMESAVENTHKHALRKKAASLGEVESIEDIDGELVIRVKV